MHRRERPELTGGSPVPAAAETLAHPMFGSVLQSGDGGVGRACFAKAALLAIGVHAAALLLLGSRASAQVGPSVSDRGEGDTTEVAVRFILPRTQMSSTASAASTPSAHKQLASKPVPMRRRLSPPTPSPTVLPPVAEHSVARPTSVEAEAEDTEEAPAETPERSGPEAVASGAPGRDGSGVLATVVGGSVGGAGGLVPPQPLTREQRQLLTSRYLQELFRSRIAAHFHYPSEAEQLGLEGLVTLRVFINRGGQLLDMRVQGPCPHTVLCDAALRTVRESVPFPPPPTELGGSIAVDVPFQYRLE